MRITFDPGLSVSRKSHREAAESGSGLDAMAAQAASVRDSYPSGSPHYRAWDALRLALWEAAEKARQRRGGPREEP
jgi:hypothetical protein